MKSGSIRARKFVLNAKAGQRQPLRTVAVAAAVIAFSLACLSQLVELSGPPRSFGSRLLDAKDRACRSQAGVRRPEHSVRLELRQLLLRALWRRKPIRPLCA